MGANDSKENNSNELEGTHLAGTQLISFTKFISSGLSFKDPSEDYNILHYLGESSFTSVYYVENKFSGYPYAMIKIHKKYSMQNSYILFRVIIHKSYYIKQKDRAFHPILCSAS